MAGIPPPLKSCTQTLFGFLILQRLPKRRFRTTFPNMELEKIALPILDSIFQLRCQQLKLPTRLWTTSKMIVNGFIFWREFSTEIFSCPELTPPTRLPSVPVSDRKECPLLLAKLTSNNHG